jgi:hypothetical protein
MREFNGMLTLSPGNACLPVDHAVPPYDMPRVHTILALNTLRLENPNTNTSGLLAARSQGFHATCIPLVLHYGPHCLQLSGYRLSQSHDPCSQNLEPFLVRLRYTIPRADPMVLLCSGSNGYPPSRFSRPRDFEYLILGLSPCELLSL